MIRLLDTASHLPHELHQAASAIALAEGSMFLTEGYLFLALLRSPTPAGHALTLVGIDDGAVAEVLRRRVPRSPDPPPPMMKVSPEYSQIESRAQGIALSAGRLVDQVDVLLALLWDPRNETAWVLHDLGHSRDNLRGLFVGLRPEFSRVQWPPTQVVEMEHVGSVTRGEFVNLAPELRSVLEPQTMWQPLHQDEDLMEIWIDKDRVSSDVRRVVAAHAGR